jgi:hypothetical protein
MSLSSSMRIGRGSGSHWGTPKTDVERDILRRRFGRAARCEKVWLDTDTQDGAVRVLSRFAAMKLNARKTRPQLIRIQVPIARQRVGALRATMGSRDSNILGQPERRHFPAHRGQLNTSS